jgi:hypothetical protein
VFEDLAFYECAEDDRGNRNLGIADCLKLWKCPKIVSDQEPCVDFLREKYAASLPFIYS